MEKKAGVAPVGLAVAEHQRRYRQDYLLRLDHNAITGRKRGKQGRRVVSARRTLRHC